MYFVRVKFSRIINYPLGLLGLKLARKSKLPQVNQLDIEADKDFLSLYEMVKPYTMAEIERCYALYQSLRHVIKNKIPGDLVECGVWKGGSAMLMALVLKGYNETNRRIWLYDTFEGMTRPGEQDGANELKEWESLRVSDTKNNMCYSPIEEVRQHLSRTGYPADNFVWVKGKVEDTIPGKIPAAISLLRLDTDWYASTSHELLHLFPLVASKGVLLIDDYGAWQGARKAVDEYFEGKPVFLHRIDWTGRLLIKD